VQEQLDERLSDLRGGVVKRAKGGEGEVHGQLVQRRNDLNSGVVNRAQGEEGEEVQG
jgi:hypothetical protein